MRRLTKSPFVEIDAVDSTTRIPPTLSQSQDGEMHSRYTPLV